MDMLVNTVLVRLFLENMKLLLIPWPLCP